MSDWRIGTCSESAPAVLVSGLPPVFCNLWAGHPGWHEDDAFPPMKWIATQAPTPVDDGADRDVMAVQSWDAAGNAAAGEFAADGRRQVAREILARARALQADMDGDPDLAAAPMVAGEVEGLWAAVRIADRELWREARGD